MAEFFQLEEICKKEGSLKKLERVEVISLRNYPLTKVQINERPITSSNFQRKKFLFTRKKNGVIRKEATKGKPYIKN